MCWTAIEEMNARQELERENCYTNQGKPKSIFTQFRNLFQRVKVILTLA